MKLLLENWREYIEEVEGVNEIFGLGKDIADIDGKVLKDIFRTQLEADDLERLIGDVHSSRRKPHPQHIKSLLEKMLRLYEEKIDPLLSQMMVVKSQIEGGSHSWPSDLSRSLESGFGGVMKHKLDDGPQAAIEHALKVLLRARGQMLGLYRKNRGYAGLPPYKPSASMHDLEKLMGQAKER